MKRVFLAAAVVALFAPAPLLANPIGDSLGPPLVLDSHDFTPLGTQAAPWLANETFTSVATGTLRLTDTDGIPLADQLFPFTSGNWLLKTVVNNTGTTWTSFEIELQETLGVASREGDGLSFAQGAGLTFTSNVFTTITKVDITRDYLHFTNGSVLPGNSVTFLFAVTDNSPQSPTYIAETPNKTDAVVPEPTSLLLSALGLAGAASRIRRRS